MIRRVVMTLLMLAAAVPFLTPTAFSAEIMPKKVRSSSTLPDLEGVSYAPENAMDKKAGTFWVEGEDSAGLGEYIQFDFPKTVTLDSLEIRPGNFYSNDFWSRHNRVSEIQVKFQTGAPLRFTLEDKQEAQILKFDKPMKTRFVRIILKGVHSGTTFNDTCISEVRFFGEGPVSDVVKVESVEASSVYLGFPAEDALDKMKDTLWCEKADGSGIGESLTLTLGAETLIKGIRLVNGTAATQSAFARNNRLAKIKIETEGGTASAAVVDAFDTPQEILFPTPVKGKTVTITVEKVIRGLDYDDTCIAEIEVIK